MARKNPTPAIAIGEPFPDVSGEAVRALFAGLVSPLPGDASTVRSVRALTKARSYQSWIIETAGGDFHLKLARQGPERVRLRATAEAAARALAGGVTVPRVFSVGCGPESPGGRPWLLQEYLSGQDAEELWPAWSPSARARFGHALGRAVGELHRVEGAEFTEGKVQGSATIRWDAQVANRLAHAEKSTARVLTPDLVARAAERVRALATQVSPVVRPRLAHRDLLLRNILADAGGSFRALLDFEYARFTDPVLEFSKLSRAIFAPYPEVEAPFRTGYAETAPENGRYPLFEERFALCQILETLGEIPYLARSGDTPALNRARAELEHWLPGPK